MNRSDFSMAAAAAVLTLASALSTAPALAEQVRIPIMSQSGDRANMNLPRTGESREAVKGRFGNPQSMTGPVGDPPIVQWTYEDFVVYFEHDHVIHAVLRRGR